MGAQVFGTAGLIPDIGLRTLVRILVFSGLCALQPVHAAWVYALGNNLHLSGKIEKGDALKIAERLRPDTRKLTLLSEGGDSEEALAIARLVRVNDTLVVVRKYCASACAVIFSLAKKHAIDEGGFVAFHAGRVAWSSGGLEALLRYQPQNEAHQHTMARLRAHNQQPLGDLGADDTWFWQMNDLTAMTWIRSEMDESTRQIKSTVKPPRCDWWVPDREGFAAIGVMLKHYQRPDKQTIAERLNKPVDRIYWGVLSDVPPALSDSPCGAPTPTP